MTLGNVKTPENDAPASIGNPKDECKHAHQSVVTYVFAIRRWLRADPAMRPEVEEALAGIECAIARAQDLLSREAAAGD